MAIHNPWWNESSRMLSHQLGATNHTSVADHSNHDIAISDLVVVVNTMADSLRVVNDTLVQVSESMKQLTDSIKTLDDRIKIIETRLTKVESRTNYRDIELD